MSPEILFVVKTDSQVTLTQLRNESVTTRSRPFATLFNHARDMCHGTSMYPASVKDELTKILCILEEFCVRSWSGTSHS